MKIDNRIEGQTGSPNSLTISGGIVLAGVVFHSISPYWLFLAVPLLLIGLTAESRRKPE